MSRLPSLSRYDASADATPQARAARRHWTRAPYLAVLAGDGCWCGEPYGHDWAGKADGAPHPRGQQDRSTQ